MEGDFREQLMKFWPRGHHGKIFQMDILPFSDEILPAVPSNESMESDAVWRCRLCILDWGLVTNLDPSFRVRTAQIWGPDIGETNWIPMDILWMLHEVAYIEHIAHLVSGASNSGMNSKKIT